ncbi:MAG: trigger factor family protein [Candidatus Marinimicrobia bacterium]|nr:trigger factor family protein [Candidatus Neomarinimicrobiota bacterium]
MQTNVKNVNSFTRQIKVSVPWTDLAVKYQAFLKKFSRKIKLPGFRKGKVPAHIIKRQYGPLADADFAEQIVQEYYVAALDEGHHEAINKANITDLHFHEGSDLRFEATFEVEPEIKLPTYKRGMKVQNITFTHDAVDIDLALKELQQHKSQLRTVESGAEEGYYMHQRRRCAAAQDWSTISCGRQASIEP